MGGIAIWGAVRFVLAFAAVLLVAAWASRWLAAAARGAGGSTLTVLGAVSLGGSRQVCAVRAGRRVLILGVGDKQVNLLCTITDPDEIALLLGPAAQAAPAPGAFAGTLSSLLSRGRSGEAAE